MFKAFPLANTPASFRLQRILCTKMDDLDAKYLIIEAAFDPPPEAKMIIFLGIISTVKVTQNARNQKP